MFLILLTIKDIKKDIPNHNNKITILVINNSPNVIGSVSSVISAINEMTNQVIYGIVNNFRNKLDFKILFYKADIFNF